MGKRMDRFWKRVDDYGNDETRDPFSHSGAYHRHFQGWAEQRVPKENGKGYRIERTYVADYYRYEESDTVWRLKKLIYIVLFALMAATSVIADSRPVAINRIPAIGAVQILSFLPIIFLLYKLILQITAPRQMTIGERDSASDGFQKAALLCAAILLAIGIAMPIEKEILFKTLEQADSLVIGLKLLSAALAFLLYVAEKKRRLERVPNKTQAPSGANEIW